MTRPNSEAEHADDQADHQQRLRPVMPPTSHRVEVGQREVGLAAGRVRRPRAARRVRAAAPCDGAADHQRATHGHGELQPASATPRHRDSVGIGCATFMSSHSLVSFGLLDHLLSILTRRQRHAAGQENPNALLDGEVGIDTLLARIHARCLPDTGDSSARRRRPAAPGPRPRSTVNSFVRNPITMPRARILDHHHALEPVLVVGRKRRPPAA